MKKALTLEQMDALIELGVPVENANKGYERSLIAKDASKELPLHPKPGNPDYEWGEWKLMRLYRKWDDRAGVQSRPAFNLDNLIDVVPKIIDVNFTLQMGTDRSGRWFAKYHSGLCAEADNLLDALFELYVSYLKQKKNHG